jgi:hypothetical protein
MHRTLVALTTGAILAGAVALSVHPASAHERCVCSSSEATSPDVPVVPLPPMPAVSPLPPLPPPPPSVRRHVATKVIIIRSDGHRHVSRLQRVVRIEDRNGDDDERMTRDEFIKRAERAFDEHDRNHDGVLEPNEREGMADADDEDTQEIEVPDAPEPPDADEAPEPPRPPRAPHAPHAPHH